MAEDQIEQRRRKLAGLRAQGVAPYGCRFQDRTALLEITEKHKDDTGASLETTPAIYAVAGRMMSLRRFGKAAFAHLQDATGRLQIYFKQSHLSASDFSLFEKLDMGDHIGVRGPLFLTQTGELTLQARQLTLLAKSLRPLPEKWHGLTDVELRYRMRYLDLITHSEVRQVFVQRAKIVDGIRQFLSARQFVEVETPMMHPIAGGAAARPFTTHHNTLDMDLYLRIAPELYLKRLIVGGFERVFEINRNFRNEGVSTIHNPEFTMLEFYMAYADYHDMMALTEQLFSMIAQEMKGSLLLQYQGKQIDLTPPWPRLSYLDAIAQKHQIERASLDEPKTVMALARSAHLTVPEQGPLPALWEALFEATVEPALTGPVFITDYPTDISPLAKRRADAPQLTERFELYIAGREIANAFSELNDPDDQRARFEAQAAARRAGDMEAHQMDEDYLQALEYGMPPTAGCGIGIDRLVMLFTDQNSIRDVILFPQMKPSARFSAP